MVKSEERCIRRICRASYECPFPGALKAPTFALEKQSQSHIVLWYSRLLVHEADATDDTAGRRILVGYGHIMALVIEVRISKPF